MQTLSTPEAVLVERQRGGWLAISAPDERLRLGVIGPDEQRAREAFDIAAARWLELCEAAKMRDRDG